MDEQLYNDISKLETILESLGGRIMRRKEDTIFPDFISEYEKIKGKKEKQRIYKRKYRARKRKEKKIKEYINGLMEKVKRIEKFEKRKKIKRFNFMEI